MEPKFCDNQESVEPDEKGPGQKGKRPVNGMTPTKETEGEFANYDQMWNVLISAGNDVY